jgi:5-formyltetrahydrofolate cyclo-ligase
MLKEEIRLLYKRKRAFFSQEELTKRSKQVTERVLSSVVFKGKIISLFLSIERLSELNTQFLLEELLKQEAVLSFPKMNMSDYSLTHCRVTENSLYTENAFGVREPVGGDAIDAASFDIVIVPLLAFDKKGNRVGYGKGYYDRFLADCSPNCLFIGLSLVDECVEIDDVEPTDIPLHFCVTPSKTYSF